MLRKKTQTPVRLIAGIWKGDHNGEFAAKPIAVLRSLVPAIGVWNKCRVLLSLLDSVSLLIGDAGMRRNRRGGGGAEGRGG